MKRNPLYALEFLDGNPYLLPFGQNIADHKRSLKLNETGVFLWNHLEEAESIDELIEMLFLEEASGPNEQEEVRNDVKEFLSILKNEGVVIEKSEEPFSECTFLSIAGIILEIRGEPKYLAKQFNDFVIFDQSEPDIVISVHGGQKRSWAGETIMLENSQLKVGCSDEEWHLVFPSFDNIPSVTIRKDLTQADISLRYMDEVSTIRENLYHVLRHIFLLKAQSLGYFAIHSASILYRGKAYLFSGPSGTGKSTHTRLWRELFDIQDINGDLNLLSDEGAVYGMPWCGTSGIYTPKQFDLGGIIFLKQAKEDRVRVLDGDDKILRISQRLISPSYTKEQLEENMSFSANLARRIPAWSLSCTKNPSAAELMKETIDHMLNRSVG